MRTIKESDTLTYEFGVLFYGSAKGIGLRKLTFLGNDSVAGSNITTGISVEGVANPAGVTCAKGSRNVSISCDVARGNLLDECIDLLEKIHTLLHCANNSTPASMYYFF